MNVFFYGLFMDVSLLEEKGISPGNVEIGYVEGFTLRIGERATLVRSDAGRAFGVMTNISGDEAKALYAENSVADYVPEPVTVILMDGSKAAATCYNLPANKVTGTNRAYADALWKLADQLGLPEQYLAEVRRAGELPGHGS